VIKEDWIARAIAQRKLIDRITLALATSIPLPAYDKLTLRVTYTNKVVWN
jgi:hypothetical protein